METVLSVTVLVLSFALLWTKARHIRFSTPLAALLSTLELAGVGIAVAALGMIGLIVLAGVNVVAFLAWGVTKAMEIEEDLAYAASQADADIKQMKAVHRTLVGEKDLRLLGRPRISQLVRFLADRARQPDEIQSMGRPIGLLWIISRTEGGERANLKWLADCFDTLLRLYDRPASESMGLADQLTAATQRSATTFDELVESLIVAGGGTPATHPS
jgi:uncharacterized membrane protein